MEDTKRRTLDDFKKEEVWDPAAYRQAQDDVYASLNGDMRAALMLFVNDWNKLPPLIRAGLGGALYIENYKGANSRAAREGSALWADAGLARRAVVGDNFCKGYSLVARLFRVLTDVADAEAAVRGVDKL